MRRLFRTLFRRALRTFFRRVEITGVERVPRAGPVIFVANHPNALVDPLLLLCFSPRPVSFLAKAPLFRMPVVGFFVRAFGSIPVHRRQDPGSDLSRNRETFEKARRLLEGGGALALFPEGASHDEPHLLPMKSGAARIALGTSAQARAPLSIVPVGLYYTWKLSFRSSALLSFGEPIEVSAVESNEKGDPPAAAVKDLSRAIERSLAELTLQSDSSETLDLVRRAEKIFSGTEPDAPHTLARELDLKRRFAQGHRRLAEIDPVRLAAVEERIERFEAERREAGLSLEHLTPEGLGAAGTARLLARNLASALLFPLAAAGLLVHYPAYRLAGFLARRIARGEDDVLATVKVAAAMLLFPATWLAGAAAATRLLGAEAGGAALLLLPLSGWAALRLVESLDEVVGRARALVHLASSRYAVKRLLAERRAIRESIVELGAEVELSQARD